MSASDDALRAMCEHLAAVMAANSPEGFGKASELPPGIFARTPQGQSELGQHRHLHRHGAVGEGMAKSMLEGGGVYGQAARVADDTANMLRAVYTSLGPNFAEKGDRVCKSLQDWAWRGFYMLYPIDGGEGFQVVDPGAVHKWGQEITSFRDEFKSLSFSSRLLTGGAAVSVPPPLRPEVSPFAGDDALSQLARDLHRLRLSFDGFVAERKKGARPELDFSEGVSVVDVEDEATRKVLNQTERIHHEAVVFTTALKSDPTRADSLQHRVNLAADHARDFVCFHSARLTDDELREANKVSDELYDTARVLASEREALIASRPGKGKRRQPHEYLVEIIALKKADPNISQEQAAGKLGIDPGHFSKLLKNKMLKAAWQSTDRGPSTQEPRNAKRSARIEAEKMKQKGRENRDD